MSGTRSSAFENAGTVMSLSIPNTSRTLTSRSGAAITVPELGWVLLISFIACGCLYGRTCGCNMQCPSSRGSGGGLSMKIYGFPLSPFVRKVVVAVKEKGLDAEVVPSNPSQPDPEFAAV